MATQGGAGRDVWGNSYDNSAVTSAGASKYAADVAAGTAQRGQDLGQGRFNQAFGFATGTMFPWLQGQLGQSQAGQPWNGGTGPKVTVQGVLNPQQVQQQVNASHAANDKKTATQNTAAAGSLAGRGFGSNSPMLMALQGQNNAANLSANTSNERDIRLGAAEKNQQAVQSTQQAAANVYGQRQQEALTARGQSLNSFNSLLAALGGLV